MGVNERTKRMLFGSATHCAFPGCDARLVRVHGDLHWLDAQIAHIRSPQRAGPRFIEGYEAVHAFENLLLLCPSHHRLVDHEPDRFPVEVLYKWKEAQIAQVGQVVTDGMLVALRRQVADLTEVLAEVTDKPHGNAPLVVLVGGPVTGWGSAWVGPVSSISTVETSEEFCYGVRTQFLRHRSVIYAGFEFEMDGASEHPVHVFNVSAAVHDEDNLADEDEELWLVRRTELRADLAALFRESGSTPQRVRAFMAFDTGDQFHSDWVPLANTPA